MRTYIVAAFADAPFRGNPAGVCILDREISDGEQQAIARELAQPETAFLSGAGNDWSVRWFSPQVEVALCGHATLAAAHVLWTEGLAAPDAPIRFTARTAGLTATPGDGGLIWLDFPALPGAAADPPADVLASIDRAPIRAARHADRWVFECATASEVRAIRPDFPALADTGIRSLILTAPSDMAGYDIVSRNFAPIVGVDEDQVTGMAHTCLAPYWQARLGEALNCWQASPRGGGMATRLKGDRVRLGGTAVIEFRFAGEGVA